MSGGGGRHGDSEVGVADLDGDDNKQWDLLLASATHRDRSVYWICGGTV
jgi:hypothetical protein